MFTIFYSKQASAITNVSPDSGSSSVNGAPAQPWLAVGTGAFNGQKTYVKVYVQNGQAATVTISQSCGLDVGSPSVQYALDALDQDETYGVGATPVGVLPASNNCGTRTMFIRAADGVTSVAKGHGAYRVFYLEAMISSVPGDNERSFRVSVSGANNLVGISKPVKGTGQAATFGIYQRDAPGLGGQEWNYNQPFAPRCTDSNRNYGIGLLDADFSVYSPQHLKLVLAKTKRGTNNWTAINPSDPWDTSAELGENGDYRALSFSADNTDIYRMQWSGINWHNTLQINVPFDEFDATKVTSADCDPPPCTPGQPACTPDAVCIAGSTVSTVPGGSVPATITMANNGTADWTSAFNLINTGSIPGGANGTVDGANPPGPPVKPGERPKFNVTVKLPDNVGSNISYTVNFQMRDSAGKNFGAKCGVVINVLPVRPECYVRFVVGGVDQATNAPITVPYGTGVTIKAQIKNPGPSTWGSLYYVAEAINTLNPASFQNIGNLVSTGPGTYTGLNPPGPGGAAVRTFPSVQGQTTWNYQVWVAPAGSPPGQAIPINCDITAYVTNDMPFLSAAPVANCRDIGARIAWRSGDTTRPITVVYGVGSTNLDNSVYYRESAPILINVNDNIYGSGYNTVIAPFQTFPDLPLHNQNYGYNIFAFDSSGQRIDIVRDGVMSTGPCLTMTCSTFAGLEVEPGDPITGSNFGSVTVTNNGYRASNPIPDNYELQTVITGGTGAVPSSRDRMQIRDGTAPVGSSSSQTINSRGGTITAGMSDIKIDMKVYYNGGVFLDCPDTDITPVTIPYLKAYGGDVIAGAKFTGTESLASPGGVRSYIRVLPEHTAGTNRSGSGGQLGVFSWGSGTTGFVSAALRAQASQGNYLTFARASSPSTTTKSPTLGLQLTGNNPVLPNYFEDTVFRVGDPRRNNGTVNPLNINNVNTNEQTVYGGSVTLSAAPNYSKRHTVYVNGDVYINGNIAYNEGGYAVIANIPNFTLVARGNIYIDNDVTALSGTYIAQPKDSSTGKIYTCASGPGAAIGTSQIKTLCGTKLTVKGSLIAANIVFNRSNNTLRDSKFKEARGSTTIAEEITFSPDVYLSPPVFRSEGSASSGSYDSISTLPPIL